MCSFWPKTINIRLLSLPPFMLAHTKWNVWGLQFGGTAVMLPESFWKMQIFAGDLSCMMENIVTIILVNWQKLDHFFVIYIVFKYELFLFNLDLLLTGILHFQSCCHFWQQALHLSWKWKAYLKQLMLAVYL
jgi:hypothetical protein